MPKKLTQKEAGCYFKSLNFKLLSNYDGMNSKVTLMCKNGHTFDTTYKNITKTPTCPLCKKELIQQEVIKTVESNGFKLISNYVSYDTHMTVECPNGHVVEMLYDNIKKGNSCKVCSKKVLPDYEYIKKYIHDLGYTLLSDSIINAAEKFSIMCPNNHKYEVSWNKFSNGRRCPHCQNKIKLTIDKVKCLFEKDGYEIIGEYVDTITPVLVKCPKGHEYKVTVGNFKSGKRCKQCGNNFKGENEIKNVLNDINELFKAQYKFSNCKNIYQLSFDFYLPQYNMCIEYDGEQHFKPVERFGGVYGFTDILIRDGIKNSFCEDNGIVLLRIPFWEFKNIKKIIKNKIANLK